jgi:hypothetical protein
MTKGWRRDVYFSSYEARPYSFLDGGVSLVQEGEDGEEESEEEWEEGESPQLPSETFFKKEGPARPSSKCPKTVEPGYESPKEVAETVINNILGEVFRERDGNANPSLPIYHVLDPRHRRGKVHVPGRKKALPEVPPAYAASLEELREKLRKRLQEVDPDWIGISRREQEAISTMCNWAGYHPRPPRRPPEIPYSACTVRIFLQRELTPPDEVSFLTGIESY